MNTPTSTRCCLLVLCTSVRGWKKDQDEESNNCVLFLCQSFTVSLGEVVYLHVVCSCKLDNILLPFYLHPFHRKIFGLIPISSVHTRILRIYVCIQELWCICSTCMRSIYVLVNLYICWTNAKKLDKKYHYIKFTLCSNPKKKTVSIMRHDLTSRCLENHIHSQFKS